MIVCIPAQDGHNWTRRAVDAIQATAKEVAVVIFDNGSDTPYRESDFNGVAVIRSEKNIGYYAPLREVCAAFPAEELVGLCHNDVIIYESDWDVRMMRAFEDDPKLGIVGLCGSNEADALGGRGAGTMCFFRGAPGFQSQAAGRRVLGLEPAVLLDSLFMMFRADMLTFLEQSWNDLPLAHFYDKIWPCRGYELGWRTAVLGIECDHAGGATVSNSQRFAQDCKTWFDERPHIAQRIDARARHGDGSINYEMAMYLEAERRFLDIYKTKKRFIPCSIGSDYKVRR